MSETKIIEDITVVFISVFGEPSKVASGAFTKMEKIIPLKGNQFYGTYQSETKEYKVCVRLRENINPELLGLEKGVIAGGLYALKVLKGRYLDIIRKIPQVFEDLGKEYTRDISRPTIEYYKRFDEFILYLPIVNKL
jgi:DNA gyrase inhibitor GyrI